MDWSEDILPTPTRSWPPSPPASSAPALPDDISIVTAFFDIGRSQWGHGDGTGTSAHARTTDRYFECFARLAKISNQIVVFTSSNYAGRVLDARRAEGLDHKTIIFSLNDIFAVPAIQRIEADVARCMTPALRSFVTRPDCPEYNFPRYNVIMALKPAFVCAAIKSGAVAAPQTAWIDFGYCRDEARFDAAVPWRFDATGKLNLFHLRPLDNVPIYEIVRTGDVYFQGCHVVGPNEAWPAFARETGRSLQSLVDADLADDDQTLMLMNFRRAPSAYIVHPVHPRDWFVIFRNFRSGLPIAPVHFEARKSGLMKRFRRFCAKLFAWEQIP